MKPATEKLCQLRAKLQALAERGVNGEATAAKAKLKRLDASVDFSKPILRTEDIFANMRVRFDAQAHFICNLGPDKELGDFVKWALESGVRINASHRGHGELWACIPLVDTGRIKTLAMGLADGFRLLWEQFKRTPGVFPSDRTLFYRGLYDGCMGEERKQGEPLPARIIPIQAKVRAKARDLAPAPGIGLHPYQVAAPLGKQLRFSASIEEVSGELQNTINKALPQTTP